MQYRMVVLPLGTVRGLVPLEACAVPPCPLLGSTPWKADPHAHTPQGGHRHHPPARAYPCGPGSRGLHTRMSHKGGTM